MALDVTSHRWLSMRQPVSPAFYSHTLKPEATVCQPLTADMISIHVFDFEFCCGRFLAVVRPDGVRLAFPRAYQILYAYPSLEDPLFVGFQQISGKNIA